MKYQNENIEYYSTHIGNIDEFMKKNEARVILFRRSNRKSDVLAHSGQDRYVQIIAERAPLYKDIQVRKEKTIFTSAIVEKLITDEFIFVQFDKKHNYEYFVYDMDHTEAFKKVREKVVQAIRDLNLDIKR